MLGILFRTVVFFAVLLLVLIALGGAAGSVEIAIAFVLAVAGAIAWRWLPTRENKLPLDH